MTDLLDLIKTRRTIREYKDQKVPKETVEKIIDAGRWAPSAHNLQPWEFIAIENDGTIKQIAGAINRKADKLFSGFNIVMRDTAKNIEGAPLLIAAYSNNVIAKKFDKLGMPYSRIVNIYEVQSVANAIENMLLYVHSVNLGAAWYGMPLFCEKEINKILRQKGTLLAMLSIGYPQNGKKTAGRKEVSEITKFIS